MTLHQKKKKKMFFSDTVKATAFKFCIAELGFCLFRPVFVNCAHFKVTGYSLTHQLIHNK